MKINYNYLGDTSGTIIVPYYFKDAVSATADLLALKAPLDGEIRKVSADGKFYQYDRKNDTWNEIVITSGSGSNQASNIITDTTNFNNNLSSLDTNVQKALDTLDNRPRLDYISEYGSYEIVN